LRQITAFCVLREKILSPLLASGGKTHFRHPKGLDVEQFKYQSKQADKVG
jgi:hypothetical protein